MTDVNPRPYRSPLREHQARRTRAAVLRAAHELFVEQGYGATTVDQVAARADVSKPTVFTSVGNKQTLLKTVRDVAMAGDDDPVPVAQRPSVDRARAAASAREALHHIARHICDLQGRYADVDGVLRGAAASGEPELRALWETAEKQRREGAELYIGLLRDKGTLRDGLAPGIAADVLSNFMAPDGYARLVLGLGWSPQQYLDWLDDTLAAQLLG